ncbi:hypothetical protein V6Z72_21710 [Cereibacter sphaeroides]|uniref:hypothetical protein n=1 Tax=Cereibacter sphaeroides TaxID=1063 RepID=UPI000C6E43FE
MKTIVTFIRPWNRYNRGETAGFDPATAAGLIGVHAVPYRPAEAAPVVPAAPAAPEPAPSFESAMAALETPAETAPKSAATGTADLPVQGRRK